MGQLRTADDLAPQIISAGIISREIAVSVGDFDGRALRFLEVLVQNSCIRKH